MEMGALSGQLRQQAARLEECQAAVQRAALQQQEAGGSAGQQLRALGASVALLQQKQLQQQVGAWRYMCCTMRRGPPWHVLW